MAGPRTKAQRERDHEDLLLAVDELGEGASTNAFVLAVDSTYGKVYPDLVRLERKGRLAYVQVYGEHGHAIGWKWVRGDSIDADQQADMDDCARQMWRWEEDCAYEP